MERKRTAEAKMGTGKISDQGKVIIRKINNRAYARLF